MRYLFIKTALCATALAFAAAPVEADWGRGGGYHGGGYGRGYGGGYGRGYVGYGLPGYGGYGSYSGYGLASYPGYDSGYSPSYYTGSAPVTTDYQSFYPPDTAAPTILPSSSTALIRVHAVPGAQLWFNDVATTQSGRVRTFTTPELQQGRTYEYEVRVRWMENGGPVERTKTIDLTPGRVIDLDLTPSSMQ